MANDPKNTDEQRSRGLHELYAEDPIKADELVWGRETDAGSRRRAGRRRPIRPATVPGERMSYVRTAVVVEDDHDLGDVISIHAGRRRKRLARTIGSWAIGTAAAADAAIASTNVGMFAVGETQAHRIGLVAKGCKI